MAKITQKKLIVQIKDLKEIKPRAEWVILAKSQVFNVNLAKEVISNPVKMPSRISNILGFIKAVKFQKKLAYSFATLAFVMVGVVGFAQQTVPGDFLFSIRKFTENSQASLTGQTGLKQEIATFNSRINDLAQASKQGKKNNIPSAINEVSTKASALTKTLKESSGDDSNAIKEITESLQVLAYLPGTDLTENSEVKELSQTLLEKQIADLEKSILTEEQEKVLAEVKELYEQEKYVKALEKISFIKKNPEKEQTKEQTEDPVKNDETKENVEKLEK
jgi:hypothetical protein